MSKIRFSCNLQSLRLEIEKEFIQESERVKSVDLHPTEPWFLASLYSGTVCIWNHQSKALVKSFKVTDSPVRSAKFIHRKNWIVTGADDGCIRVYDYSTGEKINEFQAHGDFIRCVVVHPTLPYILSSSDDGMIMLWSWDSDWICKQVFEKDKRYVMALAFNPKQPNGFASASLDGTIKLWNLDSPLPELMLDAESEGINCVDYLADGDRFYIVAGYDDFTAKIWNNETINCIKTLKGHKHNVSATLVHREFPLIFTGSEDGTVCVWHAQTYKLKKKLELGLERVWAIGAMGGSDKVVIGCDKGLVMVKISVS